MRVSCVCGCECVCICVQRVGRGHTYEKRACVMKLGSASHTVAKTNGTPQLVGYFKQISHEL